MSSALSLASAAQNTSHGSQFSGSNMVYGDGSINQVGVIQGNAYFGEQATRQARKDFFAWMKQWTDHIDFRKDQAAIYSKRYKTTGDWMLRLEEFEHWINGNFSSLLWCWGSPGIGKSVLASIVVNHLQTTHPPDDSVAIAWVYFKHDSQESQTLSTIVASFLKQLCIGRPEIPPYLLKFYQNFDEMMETPSVEEFAAELESLGNSFRKVFIVVDALDECKHENQEAILKLLFAFADKHSCTKILVTSRDAKDIREQFSNQGTPVIHIQVDNITPDIRNYVKGHIHELLQEKKLHIESPVLKDNVISRLTEKSQGMFLWVNLQIYRLCKHRIDKDIELELERLPAGLDKTYQRIIEQIGQLEPKLQTLAQKSLVWIFHSARPLSINELAEAVAVDETCSTKKDLDRNMFSEDTILDACSNLLIVEDNIVRPVHFSVLEYFRQTTSKNLHSLSSVADPSFGNNEISVCCLRYLMLDMFWNHAETEEDLMNRVADRNLAAYAAFFFDLHIIKTNNLSSVLIECIKRFLRYRNKSLKSVFQLRRFRGSSQVSDKHRVYLDIDYPIEPEDLIFSSRLYGSEQLLRADSKWERVDPPRYSLHRAVENGAVESVKSLITRGQSVDELDYYGLSPVLYACSNGFIDITAILLNYGAEFDTISKVHGNAFYAASAQGYFAIVRLLVNYGADINAQCGLHNNALCAALHEGHVAVAQFLLKYGATPNSTDESGITALYLASSRGYGAVVGILVSYGADVNAQVGIHGNALCTALYGGHVAIAELLLKHGATPESTDASGKSALYLASSRGHDAIVELLIQNNSTIFGVERFPYDFEEVYSLNELQEALEAALDIGSATVTSVFAVHRPYAFKEILFEVEIERALLSCYYHLAGVLLQFWVENVADSRAIGRSLGNLLAAALVFNQLSIAQQLLDLGALEDDRLFLYSRFGFSPKSKLLMSKKANSGQRDLLQLKALHYSTYRGFSKVLLDLEARNPIQQVRREVFTIDCQFDQHTVEPINAVLTKIWYALTRLECYRSTSFLEFKPTTLEVKIAEMCHIRQLINHFEVGSKNWSLEDLAALRSTIIPLQAAVAGVLDSLDYLENRGLLKAELGYNILIHHAGMREELIKIASIRKFPIETLNAWLVHIISTCTCLDPQIHSKAVYKIVQNSVLQCLKIFRRIGFDIYRDNSVFENETFEDIDNFGTARRVAFRLDHTDFEDVTSIDYDIIRRIDIIKDCVHLLAFGLLLYVRSHVSGHVRSSQDDNLLELYFHNIKLEEVNLASLEQLVKGPVFVFSPLGTWSRESPARKIRLQISIESFAELWGPIIEGYQVGLRYIQVQHGYICRSNTHNALGPEFDNLNSCYWEENGEKALNNPNSFTTGGDLIF